LIGTAWSSVPLRRQEKLQADLCSDNWVLKTYCSTAICHPCQNLSPRHKLKQRLRIDACMSGGLHYSCGRRLKVDASPGSLTRCSPICGTMHRDECAQNQAHAADKTPAESWLCIVFQHVFNCSIMFFQCCQIENGPLTTVNKGPSNLNRSSENSKEDKCSSSQNTCMDGDTINYRNNVSLVGEQSLPHCLAILHILIVVLQAASDVYLYA
jgi:hypothetical protein